MIEDKTIAFMKEAQQFKTILRTCRTTLPERHESDAEHSWHLALFVILMRDDLKDLDFERLLELALVHDLPEIYAGDTNPYRGDGSNKAEEEAASARRLVAILPEKEEERMHLLFQEYNDQTTPESRTIKALDKLLPLIQNLCTNERYSSYRELEVTVDEVKEYMEPFFPRNGMLRKLYLRLLNEAEAKGVFHVPAL